MRYQLHLCFVYFKFHILTRTPLWWLHQVSPLRTSVGLQMFISVGVSPDLKINLGVPPLKKGRDNTPSYNNSAGCYTNVLNSWTSLSCCAITSNEDVATGTHCGFDKDKRNQLLLAMEDRYIPIPPPLQYYKFGNHSLPIMLLVKAKECQ